VIFSGLKHKKCHSEFGPIILYTVQTMMNLEKYVDFKLIWHKHSPIWHNTNLLTGGKPFISQLWAQHGIWKLGDISGQNSILDFPDLMSHFGIPRNSQFLYFRVRSALNSLKVPWGSELKTHPIVSLMEKAPRNKTVSFIYNNLISYTSTELPGNRSWEVDIPLGTETINWEVVWNNVFGCSKNPNHQLIHYKICHRTYLTPRKRHLLGLAPNPYCTFCSQGIMGTLIHVLWECPDIQRFCVKVVDKMSVLVGRMLPLEPALLLNDDSGFKITEIERKLWLAGMTAAKKIVVLRWLPPHQLLLSVVKECVVYISHG